MDELLRFIDGECVIPQLYPEAASRIFPTLITADWCPLSKAAGAFWKEAAHMAGCRLRILQIDSDEGRRVATEENIAGVPCLVLSTSLHVYGLSLSRSDAAALLRREAEIAHAN
ncbi:thioredoxin family protein [Desulfovibrio ferrophilus]|uniref:Thioredoxin domain-containing protein n=1 Tax=Desulfovibrio ferrophilus TaxID=241368 RepID=A0A2Z6AVC2_9BACT|nr:uncharacterized protein DFE_0442 [Desulfovibrio ferrophilus]